MRTISYSGLLRYAIAIIAFVFLSKLANAQQNYYWVGGSGKWSDVANHWATTSGGSDFHAAVPTSDNNVIFDANSFTENGQTVELDLDDAECHDMDWTSALHNPRFIHDNQLGYSGIEITGSASFNANMEVELIYMGFYPEGEMEILDTKGIGFGNANMGIFLSNGGLSLADSLSARNVSFVNVFNDFLSNGNPMHFTADFSTRLTVYATIDLSNSTIYAKTVHVTSFIAADYGGVFQTEGAEIRIIHPGGYTQIDTDRHPLPLVENYQIEADHKIVNEAPVFDQLTLKPGVTLLVHDYIEGVSFNSITANGVGQDRIAIKSLTEGKVANLMQTEGEASLSHVDFQDINAAGGATFNAYGSSDLGNVTGINFIKTDQELAFEINESYDYEDVNSAIQLNGSSTSGLGITYESSNEEVAVINGNEVILKGVGVAEITASQSGDHRFYEASPVVQELIINKAQQQISFSSIPDTWIGDEMIILDASSSAGLEVTYTVTGPAIVNGNVLVFNGTGLVSVSAIQSGDENYMVADEVTHEFDVYKKDQSIVFSEIADTWVGDQFINLSATSSVGLPIEYQVSGNVTLEGNVLNLNAEGPVQVIAKQQGDALYNAASEITHSFNLFRKEQAIVFEPIADVDIDAEFLNLGATSSAELQITYSVTGPANLVGSTLELTDVGTVQITASQEGDNLYLPAENVIQQFEIFKILGLEEQIDIKVYPNPVQRELHISANSTVQIDLLDQRGIILNSTINRYVNLDLSKYEKGIYYVKISDGSRSLTRRIVRN